MANNMSIQSKFNEGDSVWAFSAEEGKFYEGIVKEVQSWDKWNGFRYAISHRGEEIKEINSEERYLYSSKQEIIDNCFISEVNTNN